MQRLSVPLPRGITVVRIPTEVLLWGYGGGSPHSNNERLSDTPRSGLQWHLVRAAAGNRDLTNNPRFRRNRVDVGDLVITGNER